MNKRIFILSILTILLLTSTCNALVVNINAVSINNGFGFASMAQDDSINHYTVVDIDGDISIYDDTGTGQVLVYDDSTSYTVYNAVIGSDGYLYIATSGGIFKRNSLYTTPSYLVDAEDSESSTFTYVSSDVTKLLVVKQGYIYYTLGNTVKKLNVNTVLTSTVYAKSGMTVKAFDYVSDEEMYFIGYKFTSDDYVYVENIDGSTVYRSENINYPANIVSSGIQYIDSETIYFGYDIVYAADKDNHHYDRVCSVNGTTTGSFTYGNYKPTHNVYSGFYIGPNTESAMVSGLTTVDIIATEDKGQSVILDESVFSYENKEIKSVYDSYYNNSDIDISYNLKTESMSYYDADQLELYYSYRIDVLNPVNVREESYSFYPSQMTETRVTGTFPVIFQKVFSISEGISFSNSNNWINGTWTVNLIETNTNTSAQSIIATDSFLVLDEQGTSNIIIEPDTESQADGIVIAETIFKSKYFYALLIIMAVACTGGAVAGGIGFSGGILIGTFVSGGFGLIPMWLILTLIIVCVLLVSIAVGSGLS